MSKEDGMSEAPNTKKAQKDNRKYLLIAIPLIVIAIVIIFVVVRIMTAVRF